MKHLKKFNDSFYPYVAEVNHFESVDFNTAEIKSCFDEIVLDRDDLCVDVRKINRLPMIEEYVGPGNYYHVQIIKNLDESNYDYTFLDDDFFLFDFFEELADDIESGINRCVLNGYKYAYCYLCHSASSYSYQVIGSLSDLEKEFGQVFCIYIYFKKEDRSNEEVYYPDLSPHYLMGDMAKSDHPKTKEFLKRNNFINIGWLDKDHYFTKGDVDPELVKKIKKAKVSSYTKGWHTCVFCDNKEDSWAARSSKECQIKGKDGKTYCFPEMLVHYITKHNYLPPKEFLDAVEEYEIPEEPKKAGGLSRTLKNKYK